jgi:hypothetical protein
VLLHLHRQIVILAGDDIGTFGEIGEAEHSRCVSFSFISDTGCAQLSREQEGLSGRILER